jgi:hypothetical protein
VIDAPFRPPGALAAYPQWFLELVSTPTMLPGGAEETLKRA